MHRLRVFGPIELCDSEGRAVRAVLTQPKRLALLAYLASSSQPSCRRDTLLGLFWAVREDARARAALNQALGFLRKERGRADVLVSRGQEEVGVDFTKLWCDAHEFRETAAVRPAEALPLYVDDFLRGFFVSGA